MTRNDEEIANETALVRVRDTVHARGCWHTRRVGTVTPWFWADDKSLWEISTARQNGIRFCGDCRPLERGCNAPGPLGACDMPWGHLGDDHQWSDRDGGSAHWHGEVAKSGVNS